MNEIMHALSMSQPTHLHNDSALAHH